MDPPPAPADVLALRAAGRPAEALDLLRRLGPAADGFAAVEGRCLLDLGRADEAAAAFARACAADPAAAGPRLGLAAALARAGRGEEALPHLDALIAADPRPAARVLRAHLLRRLGDPAAAAADFWAAGSGRAWGPADRLAFAEVLLNDGQPAAAFDRLRASPDPDDPRCRFLLGAAEEALGRPRQAVGLYRAVITDDVVGRQARGRLLAILGRRPDLPGAADALAEWPDRSRDDGYWIVRGNAELAAGRPAAAARSWEQVRRPGPDLAGALVAATRYALADAYNAGDDARVLDVVRAAAGKRALPPDLLPLLTAALARRVTTQWQGADRVAALAAALDDLGRVVPPADAPEVRLLGGFLRAAAGDPAGADPALAAIPADHPAAVVAGPVRGWARVRAAHRLLAAGRAAEARTLLAEARELWPRAAAHLDGRPEPGKPPALAGRDLADRARTRARLEAAANASGPADPLACHNLAVFHLSEAGRLAAAADWAGVLDHARRAVAYLGVVLPNTAYREAWAARRADGYGAEPTGEDVFRLEGRVVEHVEAAFGRWAAAARAHPADEAAAGLADLGLALRAEVRGARKLREAGGLAGTPGGVVAGAGYLEMNGLGGLLEDTLAGLPAGPTRDELARLFSPLRLVAVLEQEGQLEEALDRLRRSLPAGGGGPTTAAREVDLLLKLGEQEVASPEGLMDSGVRRWREAVERGPAAGRAEETAAAVREAALGRARVLDERGKFDEVVRLLDGVLEVCGDGDVRGRLSAALAARGIAAGNDGRWQPAVDDLRRACGLNEHSPHARRNLVEALRGLANEVAPDNPHRTGLLLEEAAAAAAAGLAADPGNADWQDLARRVRRELGIVRGYSPEGEDPG